MQNFAPIGRRSSEITRRKKEETTAKLVRFRKLSLTGGLKRLNITGQYNQYNTASSFGLNDLTRYAIHKHSVLVVFITAGWTQYTQD